MRNDFPQSKAGPFLAFDDQFFATHQGVLLWLLNHWLTRRWFRHVLRIRPSDCPPASRIVALRPNSFSFNERHFFRDGQWYREITTDFRTHPKFAKRLYFAFKPFWWTLHYWDELFADAMVPQLSFGFSTLTAYPDPDPETTTVDGSVSNDPGSNNFATVRGAASGTSAGPSSIQLSLVSTARDGSLNFNITRCFFLFNTAAIPDTDVISAAVISFAANASASVDTNSSTVEVVSSAPASNTNLVVADYSQIGVVSFASMAISAWVTTDTVYNDFSLNASGIANISKTGVSKFGTRCGLDLNNSSPTGGNRVGCYATEDSVGNATDPKLVVTHAAPSTSLPTKILLMGVGR